MKFSYQWLSELVDGARPDPVELGRAITMKTAECEGVELVAEHLALVAVARVLSVEPIPGLAQPESRSRSRRLWPAHGRVRGTELPRRNDHRYVPPARSSAHWRSRSRSTVSRATACWPAPRSLASAGITPASSNSMATRSPLQPDWIIEIDNKSLTHRPDLWGHYGMARR